MIKKDCEFLEKVNDLLARYNNGETELLEQLRDLCNAYIAATESEA